MLLSGKIILVTGASRGIGKAIVRKCLNSGAIVIANYRKKNDFIISLEKQYTHDRCITIQADIAKPEEISKMISITDKTYGRIDGIANNAGIISRTPNWRMITQDDWEAIIGTNLIGMWNVIRFGVDIMRNKGSIVNISSIYGTFPDSKSLTYSISKAGVIALTQALSKELSPAIRINAIAPGNTLTQMTPDSATQSAIEEKTLLKRSAQPEEIANSVAFLLSDQSSYITGCVLPVDGGYHII